MAIDFLKRGLASKFFYGFLIVVFLFSQLTHRIFAADGSGTNTVNPTMATTSSSGNTHTFTYTAAETMDGGEITLEVPSGWSTPQGVSGVAGYTTVSTTGLAGQVLDNADSITGWSNTVSHPTACSGGLSVDTTTKHEGAGAIKCVNSNDDNHGKWYKNFAAQNWSGFTTIGFWVRVTSGINNGDLKFDYSSNANLGAPIQSLSLGRSVPANTWTYVSFNFVDPPSARTAVRSFGLEIANLSNLKNATVWVDDFVIGSNSIVPTFIGNTISIRVLSLAAGQTITIVYGAGGGTSGVTTPSTLGIYTFTTKSKVSGSGTLADISLSPTINVVGPLDHFVFDTVSSPQTAGTPFNVTITAKDSANNTITSFTGTVNLTTTAGTITPTQSGAFVAGVRTESVTVTQSGALKTITATKTGGTEAGISNSFTVNAGALNHFSLSTISTQTAGTPFDVTMTAQDANNNTVTGFTSTANLTTTAGSITPTQSGSFVAGVRTESVTVTQSGALKTITATKTGGTEAGTSNSFTVNAGSLFRFTLNNPGNMTANTRLGYIVTREDQFNNLITGGVATVYPYSTASGVSTSTAFFANATGGSPITSIQISNGSSTAQFFYSEGTPGTYTITASDNASAPDGATGVLDATSMVTVSPQPIVAMRFVILEPAMGIVDAPSVVTVQAQDNAGNIDTTASSSVTLVASGFATGDGLVTIVNGVGTINISDQNAETVVLTLSDTQGTGLNVSSSKNLVFAPGAVTQFVLDNPGNMSAGTRLGFVVTRKDQFGNLVTSGTTSGYLYSSSVNVNKRFYDAASGGTSITSFAFLNGQSTANFWYYDEQAASTTVTVSDNPSTPDGSVGVVDASRIFLVTPGPVARFVLNNPGNMTAGTRLGYTLTREDQFGNLVTSGIQFAYLYTSSSGATAKFYSAATGGSIITSIAFSDAQSTVNFWYFDEASGAWVVTASDGTPSPNGAIGIQDGTASVTVLSAPIVATRFVIQPVSDSIVGVPTSVTVRAQDDSGNIDTTINAGVTLVTSGSATGGGLVTIANGVGTRSINDTVAETVTLSLLDTQSVGLNTSSTQIVIFTSQPVVHAGAGGVAAIIGVRISGFAFSGASVEAISIGATTPISKKTTAALDGSFSISFDGVAPGIRSYLVVGIDKDKHFTQTKILDANLVDANSVLVVHDILLSPSLGLSRYAITKGDVFGVLGVANPKYDVEVEIDNKLVTSVRADSRGVYKTLVSTKDLGFGSHTVRVRQMGATGRKSDFSPQLTFSVVEVFTPNLDLNNDARVDIRDWATFLTQWRSKDPKVRTRNDLNGDSKVDIRDFSIFQKMLRR